MRKSILTALINGYLSGKSHTQAYFLDAMERATDWEWETACNLATEADREIRNGARKLRQWWVPVAVKRAIA